MKKIAWTLVVLLIIQQGYAQESDSNTFTDIAQAKAFAKKKQVPILVVFAGSDWCKPCIQFKRSILVSESFTSYAKQNMAVLYLDFPLKKANKLSPEQTAQNELLAEKYNPSGAFPNILMLDASEKVLGTLSFKNQTPEDFIVACQALAK